VTALFDSGWRRGVLARSLGLVTSPPWPATTQGRLPLPRKYREATGKITLVPRAISNNMF
jgi:hypothetical protein